ncbi:MAG: hypothetical protein B6I24_05505 [Bacteroidetes bacterium 4572_128]|nr:MAG: hypothetical protein B6I24_05505 [Bacteroidetes bacterium 4572_128]
MKEKDKNATELKDVFIIHFIFDTLFLVNYFFLRSSETIVDEIILIIFIILSVLLLVFMIRLNFYKIFPKEILIKNIKKITIY